MNLEPLLDNKKRRIRLQRPPRKRQLKPIIAQQPRNDLVHLEQCQIPPNAQMTATTKLHRLISTLPHQLTEKEEELT